MGPTESPVAPSANALAGLDRERQARLRGCQRAGPARIECARWLVGEVEVEDQRAISGDPEVRPLRRVEEVAAGAVRRAAVRCVTDGQEDSSRVLQQLQHGQADRPAGELSLI